MFFNDYHHDASPFPARFAHFDGLSTSFFPRRVALGSWVTGMLRSKSRRALPPGHNGLYLSFAHSFCFADPAMLKRSTGKTFVFLCMKCGIWIILLVVRTAQLGSGVWCYIPCENIFKSVYDTLQMSTVSESAPVLYSSRD